MGCCLSSASEGCKIVNKFCFSVFKAQNQYEHFLEFLTNSLNDYARAGFCKRTVRNLLQKNPFTVLQEIPSVHGRKQSGIALPIERPTVVVDRLEYTGV